MIARPDSQRIVITGIGLTAPGANNLRDFRTNLLACRSGVQAYDVRYIGPTVAGVCHYDELRYQKKKEVRRGTRAGSIGIYFANEALLDSGLDWPNIDKANVGIYVGVTEHGNVETENELYQLKSFDYDTKFWSHHHDPRTVANNPAGEISLNLGITGPHYTIGRSLAAGNAGLIQGRANVAAGRMRRGAGWRRFRKHSHIRYFRQFQSARRLASHDDPTKASRPFDVERTRHCCGRRGLHVHFGRMSDARDRGAKNLWRNCGLGHEQRCQRFCHA